MAKGILCALVTPFNYDGSVDRAALEDLVRWQLTEGMTGFLVLGPVGEGCSLDEEEWKIVLEEIVDLAGEVTLLVEVSCPGQKILARRLRWAEEAGVAGITALPPAWYGYAPGVLANYYRQLVEATSLPVYLYNMPRVSGATLSGETLCTVVEATEGRLAGMVECSGDRRLRQLVHQLLPQGSIYHGRVEGMSGALADGATGAVVATANLSPGAHRLFWNLRNKGKSGAAQRVGRRLEELAKVIHSTGWPVAANIKAGLARLNRTTPWVRPPLVSLAGPEWDEWSSNLAALALETEMLQRSDPEKKSGGIKA